MPTATSRLYWKESNLALNETRCHTYRGYKNKHHLPLMWRHTYMGYTKTTTSVLVCVLVCERVPVCVCDGVFGFVCCFLHCKHALQFCVDDFNACYKFHSFILVLVWCHTYKGYKNTRIIVHPELSPGVQATQGRPNPLKSPPQRKSNHIVMNFKHLFQNENQL